MTFDRKCRHFNGIQHKTCRAGVEYDSLDIKTKSLPCLPDKQFAGRPHGACPSVSLLSQEELQREHDEIDAAIEKAIADINSGKCPQCGKSIEPSRIIGRCKYSACGHRIGQVATQEDWP